MDRALVNTVKALLPSVSPALASPATASRLKTLARMLPSIHRGVFECRLGAGLPQIDLAQVVLGQSDEQSVLIDHASDWATNGGLMLPAWDRLRAFCARWIEPASLLQDNVRVAWLELDADGPDVPLPSLFIFLKRADLPAPMGFGVTEEVLRVLLDETDLALFQDSIHRCCEVCADFGRAHHVGVMLSRQVKALRLVVVALVPEQIVPFLQRVGWQGAEDEIVSLTVQLAQFQQVAARAPLGLFSRLSGCLRVVAEKVILPRYKACGGELSGDGLGLGEVESQGY